MNLFVWDFHGVLEKGNEFAVVEVTNKVLEKFNINKKISLEETKKIYGSRWSEFFRFCCPEADDKMIREMVKLAIEISLSEKTALKYIKPQDNAFFVLGKIKKKGHVNLVVSNSSNGSLKYFLDSVKIGSLIDDYIGAGDYTDFASSPNGKTKVLREYTKKKKFDKVITIGDIEDDIDAGIGCGAVNYLFSKQGNKNTKADYLISDLRDVLKEV